MILDLLINPRKEGKRLQLFFMGLFYSSIAILISLWVFPAYVSIVMVFLCAISAAPLINGIISNEETKVKSSQDERWLIKEHSKVLSYFMFLFLGFTLSFTLWYLLMPGSELFSIQTDTMKEKTTGDAVSSSTVLLEIFYNNIKVLLFCMVFAFLFGIGSIFILSWNASVIGAAIGQFIVKGMSVSAFPLSLLRYFTHGLIEIGAYFAAGLAAGIISIAIIRHDFGSKQFKHILMDSVDLTVLSVVLLAAAALVEVYVTPMFF